MTDTAFLRRDPSRWCKGLFSPLIQSGEPIDPEGQKCQRGGQVADHRDPVTGRAADDPIKGAEQRSSGLSGHQSTTLYPRSRIDGAGRPHIGAGGMGEVYRPKDTKLKRQVALKVLPDIIARDPERMARFEREAEVLAALNHPHIAAIYGLEGNALVMELVEGGNLSGPLPA